jgi:hypothetical protein
LGAVERLDLGLFVDNERCGTRNVAPASPTESTTPNTTSSTNAG